MIELCHRDQDSNRMRYGQRVPGDLALGPGEQQSKSVASERRAGGFQTGIKGAPAVDEGVREMQNFRRLRGRGA
jgi:hypothetical protein